MTKNQKIIFLFFLIFIIIIYSNIIHVPFYLDDIEVINPSIKIGSLSFNNIFHVLTTAYAKNRPVANLTFILDYHFAKEGNTGRFHLVNIAVHILGFLFIFLFLQKLLGLPSVPQKYRKRSSSLALIVSVLWAFHPLQTQSVTYIVQRMTSLCTLFYFVSLYFYLKARTQKKTLFYVASGLAFLLALGSKEIGATIPLAILLIEGFFFQPNRKKFLAILLLSALVIALVSWLFVGAMFDSLIRGLKNNKYANRDYLISERLLTEPRVFVHYISLTLFPFFTRYILDYDYPPSRSLFVPFSTFLSLLFLLATIGAAVYLFKRNRLISFAILTFWLGHVIEGSIFNLEIAFEHRMYLPSVFLIFIVVLVFADGMERIKIPKKAVAGLVGAVLLFLGVNTYLKNELWKDPIKFYEHNIAKAPRNFRPYHNLGVEYGMRKDYPKALDYFNKALALKSNAPVIYAGIAQAYYAQNEYQTAIPYYLKSLEMGLAFADLFSNLSLSYLRTNKYEEAIIYAVEGLRRYPEDLTIMARVGSLYYFIIQELGNKGQALLKKYGQDEGRAFALLETAYALGNREKDVIVNLPPAYVKSAQYEPAGEKQTAWLQKAEKIATEGYQASSQDADLRNNLIGICLVKGQWRDALKLPGLSKDDLNKLAVHLLNKQLFQEAQEVLKKLQADYGLDQVIEFNQAICSYYLGHEDEAVKTFQRIMATTSAPVTKYQANHFITEWQNKHARK